jgi:hypothetical protein
MKRILMSALLVLCIAFTGSLPAFAVSPKNVSDLIERDLKYGITQIRLSKNEFWDLQLRTLNSPEAQAVAGKYRDVQGYQLEESQFLVEAELRRYRIQVVEMKQATAFFPEVHKKLLEVIDIWIDKRAGKRPFSADDLLPGELRNAYPKIVEEALSYESLKLKQVLVRTAKALAKEKSVKQSNFQTAFEFYFNQFALERFVRNPSLLPIDRSREKQALSDLKRAETVSQKYSIILADKFNKSVGSQYLKLFDNYRLVLSENQKIYKSYASNR